MTERDHPEIAALHAIEKTLLTLPLEAQNRIARWLNARVLADTFWQAENQRQCDIERALEDSGQGA